jgi:hypothetical protein
MAAHVTAAFVHDFKLFSYDVFEATIYHTNHYTTNAVLKWDANTS